MRIFSDIKPNSMKFTFLKRSIYGTLVAIMFFLFSPNAQAQDFNFDQFLSAGAADANTLISNYMKPAMTGFGYGINGGWYNTAKTHKKLGFDLTISVNAAQVPDADEFFIFNNADYSGIRLANGTSAETPTLMGSGDNGPQLVAFSTVNINGTQQTFESAPFNAPKGLGLGNFNVVPVPTINLGIGIIKNTDLKVRYVPEVSQDDFKMSLIGFGIMHDIKQYIPFLKRLPIDVSVLAAYTDADIEYDLNGVGLAGRNQLATYDVTAWTAQVLVSKKLALLTVYGGLGYNSATTSLAMSGDYDIEVAAEVNGQLGSEILTLTDPVDLEFDSNGVRATVGLRIKLAVLTFHADYTAQEYNIISGGFGIALR